MDIELLQGELMTTTTRAGTVAAFVAAAALVSACGPDGALPSNSASSASSSPSGSPSGSPSPSVSKTPSSSAQAEKAVVAYWELLDRLASDPSTSLTDLSAVARGSALTQWQRILTKRRGQQYTQTGRVSVEDATVKADGPGRWDVSACIDATNTNVVDKDGKSVRGTGPLRVKSKFVIERDKEAYFVTEEEAVEEC